MGYWNHPLWLCWCWFCLLCPVLFVLIRCVHQHLMHIYLYLLSLPIELFSLLIRSNHLCFFWSVLAWSSLCLGIKLLTLLTSRFLVHRTLFSLFWFLVCEFLCGWVSWIQKIFGFWLLILFANLCLFIGELRPFTLRVITKRLWLIPILAGVLFCCLLLYFSLFLFSYLAWCIHSIWILALLFLSRIFWWLYWCSWIS